MKKLRYNVFNAAVLLLIFGSPACKKHGKISGRVINQLTGQPLANVPLSIGEYNGAAISPGPRQMLARTTTDSEGHFVIYYKGSRRLLFRRDVTVEQNYSPDTIPDLVEAFMGNSAPSKKITNKPDDIELQAMPLARIKVVAINNPPVGQFDYIQVQAYTAGIAYQLYENFGPQMSAPFNYVAVPSNGAVRITWESHKGNITTTGQDTIFAKPFEKTVYHITY